MPSRSEGVADVASRLPRTPGAAGRARRMVIARMGPHLSKGTLDDVLLVVSELVNNAVLHGSGDIALRVAFDGRRVTGDVCDEGAGFTPAPDGRGRDRSGGRGLLIVEEIADRWGLHRGSAHVWFEITARRRAASGRAG